MAFTKGKAKKVRVMFNIKPSKNSKTAAARRAELKKFYAGVKRLAKQHHGSEKHSK